MGGTNHFRGGLNILWDLLKYLVWGDQIFLNIWSGGTKFGGDKMFRDRPTVLVEAHFKLAKLHS